MKINTLLVFALLASTSANAGEIASRFLCTDGSIIRLETNTGPHMVVTWQGNRFPVRQLDSESYGVHITAGVPGQSTAMMDIFWLNEGNRKFFATFATSPKADTVSVECSHDLGSNKISL